MIRDLDGWSHVLGQMPTAMFVRDAEGRWVYANRMSGDCLGIDVDQVAGKRDGDLFPPDRAARIAQGDEAVLRSHQMTEQEESIVDAEGRARTLLLRKTRIDIEGEPHVLASVTDVTELRESEAHVRWLACHDALTGLANRTALFSRLDAAVARAAAGTHAGVCHLLYLDLDRFKHVNDTYGHAAGDELLIQFAMRLRTLVRPDDTVARIGGDEFAMLVETPTPAEIRDVAEQVLAAAAAPFDVLSNTAFIGTSIGIVPLDRRAVSSGEVARRADTALFEAKKERNGYVVYSGELDAAVDQRREVERALATALRSGEGMACHYQPLVRARDGQVVGVEALARWTHPVLGSVSPVHFIPVAEEAGLIHALGEWVLRTACQRLAGVPELSLAVNVSAVQLRDPCFASRVLGILGDTGLEAQRLELEITETAIVNAQGPASRSLKRLREAGVRISLDDFGTGYSSLTLLRDLDVDKVKIDRSFVQTAPQADDSAAIVRAVTHLGRALGLCVVAEGVETEDQRAFLREAGCHELQGYLFSAAVPGDRIASISGPFDVPVGQSVG